MVTTIAQTADQACQRVCDPIDLRWICFRDEGNVERAIDRERAIHVSMVARGCYGLMSVALRPYFSPPAPRPKLL